MKFANDVINQYFGQHILLTHSNNDLEVRTTGTETNLVTAVKHCFAIWARKSNYERTEKRNKL